jgi:hypothetical protein
VSSDIPLSHKRQKIRQQIPYPSAADHAAAIFSPTTSYSAAPDASRMQYQPNSYSYPTVLDLQPGHPSVSPLNYSSHNDTDMANEYDEQVSDLPQHSRQPSCSVTDGITAVGGTPVWDTITIVERDTQELYERDAVEKSSKDPELLNESVILDLTGEVHKLSEFYETNGGFCEIYKGEWLRGDNVTIVAMKMVRFKHSDDLVRRVMTVILLAVSRDVFTI